MTIAIAWVRKILDCEELVFVSDSRLSGDGRVFDACPKVLTLPRTDCAISFAGYTGHAFPLMLQLSLAIDSYAPARRGSLDLSSLKSHALKVFDGMAELIASSERVSAPQNEDPEAQFLFGGYSWVKKQFGLWSVAYCQREGKFVAQPAQWLTKLDYAKPYGLRRTKDADGLRSIGRIALAGDQATKAFELLSERLTKYKDVKLDMQPFEVVRDMLRDENHSETIGGSPQIVKVYQYMKSAPLAVYWPTKEGGAIHLQGRPCLGYERIDRWVLDPDTLVSERPVMSRDDIDDADPESEDTEI